MTGGDPGHTRSEIVLIELTHGKRFYKTVPPMIENETVPRACQK